MMARLHQTQGPVVSNFSSDFPVLPVALGSEVPRAGSSCAEVPVGLKHKPDADASHEAQIRAPVPGLTAHAPPLSPVYPAFVPMSDQRWPTLEGGGGRLCVKTPVSALLLQLLHPLYLLPTVPRPHCPPLWPTPNAWSQLPILCTN